MSSEPAVVSAVLQPPDVPARILFTPLLALLAYLTAFNEIHARLGLALGVAAALLILDLLGWGLVSALRNRERLITAATR